MAAVRCILLAPRATMQFRRFYNDPLSQACYVLADGGEAIVVDPLRDATDVLAYLEAENLRARWVVGTHVHADFVAGLGEIAAATGARVGLGEAFAGCQACERLEDGAELRFGDRLLRVLSTPGHTIESISLQVPAAAGTPPRLLTGDMLFVGDVGRPDLAQGMGLSARTMAGMLFATLRDRIAGLPGDTEVWPAHGAGSPCGTCIDSSPSSTLQAERANNWALRETDEGAFCERLLRAQRTPPRHFATVAAINAEGPALLATLPQPRELTFEDAARAVAGGAVLLDVRTSPAHGRGHWPGCQHIGVNGNLFETWAGSLLPRQPRLVLHAGQLSQADLAVRRLRRVGLDDVAGFVLAAPPTPQKLPQIEAVDLWAARGNWQVIDVRRPVEFAAGHVPGAAHCELTTDMDTSALASLDRGRLTAAICESGYRSSIASRRLLAMGFTALHNVGDGMQGWRRNHLPLESGAGATASR
jgi:hydroxyacylglutathione hydrolase